MELTTLYTFLFIILGFLIAEFQNAYVGNQSKESKIYFSIIGVEFTQKDFQRLLFAISLGIGVMFLLPIIQEFIDYEIKGRFIYIIVGYAPSTVMILLKNKLKSKGIDMDAKEGNTTSKTTGGGADPDKEEK